MILVISQRNDLNKNGDLIDSLENNYINYFEKFGITLLPIPNSFKNIETYFKEYSIDGIILSGGNDVDPRLYGEERTESCSFSVLRDQTEKKLLEIGIKRKLPVLGICRGMQFINVYFGGKLAVVNAHGSHPPAKNHFVSIIEDKLKPVLGEKIEVNSYHNWGLTLKELSSRLKSFAITADGIIEGIYHPALPIAGIQWHPERESPDEKFNELLIKSFIERKLFWKK